MRKWKMEVYVDHVVAMGDVPSFPPDWELIMVAFLPVAKDVEHLVMAQPIWRSM
jgi:hypothetical protein